MKKEFTICGIRVDRELFEKFEEAKMKLNALNPIDKPLHNTDVLEYALRYFIRNFENEHKASRKLELIREIVNK